MIAVDFGRNAAVADTVESFFRAPVISLERRPHTISAVVEPQEAAPLNIVHLADARRARVARTAV